MAGGDVPAALETSDPVPLLPDEDELARARRWFRSFGCCSVLDVHEDLVDLGLWRNA